MTTATVSAAASRAIDESASPKRTAWEQEHFHSRLIWLWPASYAAHIAEEYPRFGTWVHTALGGAEMTPVRFWINNAFYMAGMLVVCAVASRKRTAAATFVLFAWTSGNVFWNFWFHWYTTLQFHEISPGVVTATVLYYPVSLYLYYLAWRDGHLRLATLLLAMAIGLACFAFVVWFGLYHLGPFPWRAWVPA
jgi:hypothetical protein